MRNWKLVTLLLIVAMASACATAPDSESDATASEESASGSSAPAAKAAPRSISIPAGTTLNVVLSTSLSSGTNNAGDTFSGNLGEAVMVGGETVLPKGTSVEGKVVDAEGSGRVKGLAHMSVTLTGATVDGKNIALNTSTYAAEAESTKGRDAAVIGGGAGIGAAIGAIAGGAKGAAVGAAVGGGAGTGTVLATKGKEVEFPAESSLSFTLDKAVTLTR